MSFGEEEEDVLKKGKHARTLMQTDRDDIYINGYYDFMKNIKSRLKMQNNPLLGVLDQNNTIDLSDAERKAMKYMGHLTSIAYKAYHNLHESIQVLHSLLSVANPSVTNYDSSLTSSQGDNQGE